MLTGRFEDAGDHTPRQLQTAYERLVADVVREVGAESAAAQTDIDESTLTALLDGDSPELTLEDAAALLALSPEYPDADGIVTEARDILLMGMTTAVMDVDSLAAQLGGDMEPKLIQQKIEGRYPITLGEYARLHQAIAEGSP